MSPTLLFNDCQRDPRPLHPDPHGLISPFNESGIIKCKGLGGQDEALMTLTSLTLPKLPVHRRSEEEEPPKVVYFLPLLVFAPQQDQVDYVTYLKSQCHSLCSMLQMQLHLKGSCFWTVLHLPF